MDRITLAHLQAIVDRINKIMGTPMVPWVKDADGHHTAQIGNYHLDGAYGGYALEQMVGEGGGVRSIFGCGHVSKRDLANRMHAFIAGIEAKAA